MKIPTMTELGDLNSSDKVEHGYTNLYNTIFAPVRYAPLRILEIGYARGRGTRTLAEFFPRAVIHSFDIEPNFKHYNNLTKELKKRIKLYQGDQSNPNSVQNVLEQIYNGPRNSEKRGYRQFDIVIDDGSHNPDHQQISFKKLWPEVKNGGVYIIEDFHPYYKNKQHETVSWLFNLVHEINRYGNKYLPPSLDLFSITFTYNQALIQKTVVDGRY